jgi:tRNA (cmo5U34)-methyltransferase
MALTAKILKKRIKDNIFAKRNKIKDFTFDKEVADVFDDMLVRSVPFYLELQRMIGEIAAYFAQKKTRIYDLGCSTGTTLIMMIKAIDNPLVEFVGVDYSRPMLEKTMKNIRKCTKDAKVELIEADLNKMDFDLSNASVVTMNWTLQFVRPLYREKLIRKINKGLVKNGALILCEKVLVEDSMLNRLYIELYYNFKRRQGYSEMEIAQKREALENILIPYRADENTELLKKSGFRTVDSLFRWYNWASFIAIKS